MTVQEEVVSRLKASVLSTSVAGRIWPALRTNPLLPAVTYGVVSALPQNSLDGFTNFTRYRVQVDIWSREYSEAQSLVPQVRDAVIGTNATDFKALYIDVREFYESDVKLWNIQQDFSIHFNE